MRKLILLVVFLPLFVLVPAIHAQSSSLSTRSGEAVEIKSGEVIDRDYFITGDTVNVAGEINGDLYAAGGNVNISGKVNGDLLVAGGTVSISGEVTQDIRAAGGNIVVSGVVGRNLTTVAGNVDITNSASIAGSLVAGAGNVNVSSAIPGNVTAGAGSIIITSSVGGDVEVGVGQLTLASGASVGGNMNYYSEEEASIDESVVINGSVTRNDPTERLRSKEAEEAKQRINNFGRTFGRGVRLVGFLSALLIGMLMIKFIPKCLGSTSNILKSAPLRSLGFGLLTLFSVPFISIILMFTLVGLPLAFITISTYLIFIYLTKIFISFSLGQLLLSKANLKQNDYYAIGVGLVFYTLLTFIPYVGGLFKFLALMVGLGAMVMSSKKFYVDSKKKGIL